MASPATPTSNDWQATACILCSVNCGLQVKVEDRHLVKIKGDKSNPRSKGYTCEKQALLDHYQNNADRRRAGDFERVPQAIPTVRSSRSR